MCNLIVRLKRKCVISPFVFSEGNLAAALHRMLQKDFCQFGKGCTRMKLKLLAVLVAALAIAFVPWSAPSAQADTLHGFCSGCYRQRN